MSILLEFFRMKIFAFLVKQISIFWKSPSSWSFRQLNFRAFQKGTKWLLAKMDSRVEPLKATLSWIFAIYTKMNLFQYFNFVYFQLHSFLWYNFM